MRRTLEITDERSMCHTIELDEDDVKQAVIEYITRKTAESEVEGLPAGGVVAEPHQVIIGADMDDYDLGRPGWLSVVVNLPCQ